MASLASHPMVAFSPVVAFRETRPGAGFCAVARRDGARSPCAVALGAKRRVAPVAAVARASRGDAPRRSKGARASARRAGGTADLGLSVRSMAERRARRASPPRRSPARSTARPTLTRLGAARAPPTPSRRAVRARPARRARGRRRMPPLLLLFHARGRDDRRLRRARRVGGRLRGGPAGALVELQRFGRLLVENHLPGVGGVIEDSFLGLLVACTVYSLWRSSLIPAPVGNPIARKSRTPASWLHVVSGGGALATGLYGVVLERVYRESPGWGGCGSAARSFSPTRCRTRRS